MKKLVNLIALVMLVSTNVFTPFSYAQVENPELIPENEVENIGESIETPEYMEEFPEKVSNNLGELEQENQDNEIVMLDVQDDVETSVTDETEEEDTESDGVARPVEETPENEIQDEEGKIEELEKVEESVIMDVIPNTSVMLLPGQEFNSVIKTLANGGTYVAYTGVDNNIQSFERVDELPAGVTTGEISVAGSEYPVHAWFSGGILYYTTQAETIQLNEDSQNMFQNFGALIELDLSSFDTSNVTNMYGIFAGCSKLGELNLNGWDFSNTSVNMMNMTYGGLPLLKKINMQNTKFSGSLASAFASLNKVEEIDLSGADVRNVTNMGGMFSNCSKLEKLNLNGWYFTGSIGGLFAGLTNLKEISLKGVDTKGVTDMGGMFSSCSSLTGLDLSSFDTSKVTNMGGMLGGCNKLEELNLSGWNFSKSSSTPKNLFGEGNGSYCSSSCNLKKLNLTNVKFGQSMNSAFMDFRNLEELKLDGIDTSDVTDMRYMFKYCSSNLTGLDLSNFDTSNVTDMFQIFAGCYDLEMLNLSGWDFHQIPSYGYAYGLIGDFFSSSPSKLKILDMTNAKFPGNMSYAFRDLVGLEELKLDGVVTSGVINMNSMFYNCKKLTGLNLGSFDTSNVTDMRLMFYNCSSLTGLDLRNFDTSSVTSMGNIFNGCSKLEDLNLSGWDFTKVTDMSPYGPIQSASQAKKLNMENTKFSGSMNGVFSNLANLEEINLSGADVSSVTNMSYVFNGCRNLKEINLQGWDTSNVTTMNSMFYYCNSLEELDLSGFDTSRVTDMTYLFGSCSSLEKLNLDNWSFYGNPTISNMFYGTSSLKILSAKNRIIPENFTQVLGCNGTQLCANDLVIDVSNWNLSKAKNLGGLFKSFYGKEIKGLYTWDTSGVTNMSQMFQNCSNLTGLDLSGFDTSSVTNMGQMFQGCSNLTGLDLNSFNTSNVTNMNLMFQGCSNLTGLDLSSFNTSNVTNMGLGGGGLFMGCNKLEEINMSGRDFRNLNNSASLMVSIMGGTTQSLKKLNMTNTKYTGNVAYAFGGLGKLEELNLDGADTKGVTNMNAMFERCDNLTELDLSSFDTSNVNNVGGMFGGCSKLEEINLSGWDFRKISNASLMMSMNAGGIPSLTKLNMTNTKYTGNATYAFGGLNKLEELNLNGADTSNVTSMNAMFNGDSNLKILDLGGLDTSNVKDMSAMFYNCSSLTGLNLNNFDTSSATSMGAMFYGCSGLNELDLANFDTSKVTAMGQMFYNTPNLKTIYASEKFVTTALSGDTSSKDMFSGTTSVIGGNGTKFDPNYIDKTYALIDKVGQTGYFTDKNSITVKFINTLDGTETYATFAKGQKLTPPSVDKYHVAGGYLDEAMTQEIDLNKGVDSYTVIHVKYDHNGSSGGGGGGGSTKPDTSKDEQQPSQSDASTGTNVKEPESNTGSNIQTGSQVDPQPTGQASEQTPQNDNSNIQDSSTSSQNDTKTYSTEFQEAYEFAKSNGITTMPTIQKADMNGKLTRIQMAKMLSQYAINVLGQTPDTSKTVKFKDVTAKRDADYDNGVTLAYQLGIMGQNMPGNNFRPNDEVTRAEFATALSRLLYQTTDGKYKSTKEYYIPHMAKLYNEGIISNTDPSMAERRGYVMIMLMRSAK